MCFLNQLDHSDQWSYSLEIQVVREAAVSKCTNLGRLLEWKKRIMNMDVKEIEYSWYIGTTFEGNKILESKSNETEYSFPLFSP